MSVELRSQPCSTGTFVSLSLVVVGCCPSYPCHEVTPRVECSRAKVVWLEEWPLELRFESWLCCYLSPGNLSVSL